ncbi:hypothetical protein B0H10DRAFT_2027097 [Mycena sp. CBHHK59/15]|nr:hypothetical protein B0H10DRAFT_2081527 [Mycena sp. CBHHK59/15]KAJ6619165.1 hypothetical protein B0H10DRAFT_2027097 [Mycena sp. CBHHK59/15]
MSWEYGPRLPVPGAREGIQALRDMSYKLVIVTARTAEVADGSWEWVEKYVPGKLQFIAQSNRRPEVPRANEWSIWNARDHRSTVAFGEKTQA